MVAVQKLDGYFDNFSWFYRNIFYFGEILWLCQSPTEYTISPDLWTSMQ